MKYTYYSLWFLPLLFLIGSKEQSYYPGQNYALFFAVDDYESSQVFDDLKNPVRDADAIATELREMYNFEAKVYKNCSRQQIYDVLRTWQSRSFQPDDQLFVFFSGHGDFDDFTSKGYYVAHGNRTREDKAYIDLTTLGNIVTKIPCKHLLIAIDACYSGTIDQEIALKGKTFARAKDGKQAEKNRLIQNQLRNKTRLLITSGGKRRTRDGVNHSPFSEALLRGLRGAYSNRDGLFLYSDLLSELERISPTPHEGELVGHEQGGFVFVAKNFDVLITKNNNSIDSNESEEKESSLSAIEMANEAFFLNKEGNFKEAIAKYEEAILKEENNQKKGEYYYSIATIQFKNLDQKSLARASAYKAAELKPKWGRPYLLVGDMYASSTTCRSDKFGKGLIILAAISKYNHAKNIDSNTEIIADANRKIDIYSPSIPDKAEAFMRGHKDGTKLNTGCWIEEMITLKMR
ncbi:MAG: hypothetical protein Sapg2KO_01140 [Saprospiraceae bacterium]